MIYINIGLPAELHVAFLMHHLHDLSSDEVVQIDLKRPNTFNTYTIRHMNQNYSSCMSVKPNVLFVGWFPHGASAQKGH